MISIPDGAGHPKRCHQVSGDDDDDDDDYGDDDDDDNDDDDDDDDNDNGEHKNYPPSHPISWQS